MRRSARALVALAVLSVASESASYQLTDTLKGSTVGNPVGGSIGPNGWTVTARTDRLWYAIPRLVSGSIQFTITGATLANLTVADNELFAMYEAGYGISEPIDYSPEYRNNYYKCMIRVYGTDEPSRTGQQKLIWGVCNAGSPGYGEGCPCANGMLEEPFGGDPSWDGSPVTLRVEWGSGQARLYKNGSLVKDVDYAGAGPFGPDTQHFSLGSSRSTAVDSSGLPVGAVFSDVIVDGVEGPAAPSCTTGAGGSGGGSGTGGSGGSAACDPNDAIDALLESPQAGSGSAAVFRVPYTHCAGANAFRVVQLWITDAIQAGSGISVGYENGILYGAGSTEQCTPGEAKKLGGPYGALDCQNTTVSSSGNDLIVGWAIELDAATYGGTHGVWADAKGGSGDPEPRLGWTKLGDFTVNDSGPAPGWPDGGGGAGAGWGSGGSAGSAGNESRGDASGDDSGCGCRVGSAPADRAAALAVVALAAALLARRRR